MMSTTTESATTEVTTKEGVEIKGKDVIKLTAPEILPPAGQLLTVAQDIVGALNELKKGLDEKGSDEWKFPKGWIDIPDPSANQIIMMVEIDDTSVNQPVLAINLESQDGQGGCEGVETIDWGDGYIDSMPFNYKPNYGHKYKEKGQYIITINCSTTMNCLNFDINVWTVGYIDGVSPSTS
ncbi:MAG: hypothetical protein IJY73_00990, partial [Oscillospiraceae bacterium]|nr:hypothetical protein [Oscillospiraceae bacterium]